MCRKITLLLMAVFAMLLVSCKSNTAEPAKAASGSSAEVSSMTIRIAVNGHNLTATLADNSSSRALVELLKDGEITVHAHDYGSFEKVGSLPRSLPRNDEDITTSAEETLEGLKAALGILKPHGTISMTLYWGHPQGKTERKVVLEYCRQLDPGEYHITYLSMPNQDNCPPEIILINN